MTIGVLGHHWPLGQRVLDELERQEVPGRPAELDTLRGLDAVVSVGHDMASVDAAVAAEVPYVDASTDAAFVADVLARHAAAAVPVVPACGFDGLLGDLGAAVAAEHYGGPIDRIEVHLDSVPVSMARAMSPLLERVLVPRHVPGAEVLATAVLPVPHAFRLVAEASGLGPRTFVACEGEDPGALGVRFLVAAARAVAQPGQPPGAMAPAEAFDAERFLDAVAGPDLRWSFSIPDPGDLTA